MHVMYKSLTALLICMIDVHVVGGGPAGCFAGISAALCGKNVLLSEEHLKIGEPEACSGLISKSGLQSLRPYIDYKRVEMNQITAAKIISGKQEFCIKPKGEEGVLVSRCELDRLASDRFVQEGGKLSLGRKVSRDFQANCIIGADGPASSVADYFGFPKIRSFVASMQGNFRHACQDAHQAEIYLSSTDFPGFFGWAIPINEEEAKLGMGVALPHHPLKYYRKFIAKLGAAEKPENEFAAVIPTSVREKTAMGKGGRCILLAGDAAGQVKATTGGGVFFGAQCGMLAGEYCNQPETYEREWKGKYGLDLALHRHLRTLLDIGGGAPSPLLLSMAKTLFFEDLISEKGEMDQWGRMLSPSILSAYAGIIKKKVIG